ncbi:MAG: hypothetical protein JWM74_3811 [Myxococcaceae bacterium]|nr:hypothetical protein [Myxococcaceae bacterium]
MTMRARSPLAFLVLTAACLAASSTVFVACSSDEGTPAASSDASAGADQTAADGKTSSETGTDAASTDGAACKLVKPYSSKDKVCNGCAETACCAEVNGCLGDPACDDDYVNCILACVLLPDDAGADVDAGDAGIPACEKRCGTQYPKGEAEYLAATGCVDTKCKTDCK